MIIGAGLAGLMTAERLSTAEYRVHVYDAKSSACRKLLLTARGRCEHVVLILSNIKGKRKTVRKAQKH